MITGYLIVEDHQRVESATCQITGIADITAVEKLAAAIQPYTRGCITVAGLTEDRQVNKGPAVTGPYCMSTSKAKLVFTDTKATEHERTPDVTILWPCPDENLFEPGTNGNFIVQQSAGTAMAASINTALGLNFAFDHGVLLHKSGKN